MRDNRCNLGEKWGIMIKIVILGKGKKLELGVLVSEMFGGLRGGTELCSLICELSLVRDWKVLCEEILEKVCKLLRTMLSCHDKGEMLN